MSKKHNVPEAVGTSRPKPRANSRLPEIITRTKLRVTWIYRAGMVVHACSPNTWGAEKGTVYVWSQPLPQDLSQKPKEKTKTANSCSLKEKKN